MASGELELEVVAVDSVEAEVPVVAEGAGVAVGDVLSQAERREERRITEIATVLSRRLVLKERLVGKVISFPEAL